MATNKNLANADINAAYNAATTNTVFGHGVQVLSAMIDLKGAGASDTWTLFKLPIGATVLACNIKVVEITNQACTLSVGVQAGATTVGTQFAATGNIYQAAGTQVNGAGSGLADTNSQILIAGGTAAVYVGATNSAAVTQGKVIVSLAVLFNN